MLRELIEFENASALGKQRGGKSGASRQDRRQPVAESQPALENNLPATR